MSEVLSLTVASADGGEHRHDLEGTGHHVVECRDDPMLPGYCTLRFTRPSTPAPPGCEPLPASQAQAAKALVHLLDCGTLRPDPSALTLQPGTGGRLTFGGSCASLGSGHLHLLVQRYCGSVGARFGARLRAWLPGGASRTPAHGRLIHDIVVIERRSKGLEPKLRCQP